MLLQLPQNGTIQRSSLPKKIYLLLLSTNLSLSAFSLLQTQHVKYQEKIIKTTMNIIFLFNCNSKFSNNYVSQWICLFSCSRQETTSSAEYQMQYLLKINKNRVEWVDVPVFFTHSQRSICCSGNILHTVRFIVKVLLFSTRWGQPPILYSLFVLGSFFKG